MPRKQPFPPEADTQPDITRPSARAPKSKRAREEVATVPPPKSKRNKATENRNSGIRSRRPPSKRGAPGAKVDEVTADLSKDPRRDRDE
jgi:hypothetical protein